MTPPNNQHQRLRNQMETRTKPSMKERRKQQNQRLISLMEIKKGVDMKEKKASSHRLMI